MVWARGIYLIFSPVKAICFVAFFMRIIVGLHYRYFLKLFKAWQFAKITILKMSYFLQGQKILINV